MDLVYKRGYRRICVTEKMHCGKQERGARLDRCSDHPANCKPHKPDWDAFVAAPTFARLKQQIWNPNCCATNDGCHNHTPPTSENFSPKMCNATTLKVRSQRFSYENLKRNFAFALNSQKPLKKQRKFMQSLTQRERLQSRRTQAGKKSFFSLKEHDEDFGKQE